MFYSIGNSLRKRFCKDFSIPIHLIQDPYFEYFVDLYDPLFSTKIKIETLLKLVEVLGSEKRFFELSENICHRIIQDIRDKKEFSDFNSKDLNKLFPISIQLDGGDLYRSENNNLFFCSIDLVKANFQSMKLFSPSIVSNKETYSDFLFQYTDEEYFHKSKMIRQIIFGNLNTKRQGTIQRFILSSLIKELIEKNVFKFGISNFRCLSTDELFFSIPSDHPIEYVKNELEKMLSDFPFDIKIQMFKLTQLGSKLRFVREFYDGAYDLRCIPSVFFPQYFKYYNKLELNDFDMCFYHEGHIAKFLDNDI